LFQDEDAFQVSPADFARYENTQAIVVAEFVADADDQTLCADLCHFLSSPGLPGSGEF
jgi:glycine betaine/choline ABC-type transport system substrate-binding protein